ncbi:hypothetical protein VOLCADRAFT_86130 [Volvox carteri f. nagariensis]|uniref:Uncharacterized protein n=1 Tax=Volvox carteri f. nagariensis TaxID=3068 RepID=D8THY6_VOLCA|nr:uncharacterized protein VOLCADRAFT_86130 [Volvox carteri f. nagariensis]EFJ52799.1 hypothetical protein VOLCADRAFT_86130 [Volvox carteri f. nagariensis]|eukprot:XP_002945804.1 hypothetical protein VOLCADRAFT_86130 [Volvox carteri f. nagariensis]
MSGLSSLSGAPPPGVRRSVPDSGGAKSPFDDNNDEPKAGKSTFKDPFSDDPPLSTRGGRAGPSTSSAIKPSASNPAFKWEDDDSPPRGKSSTAGKALFGDDDDDFLSSLAPDSVAKKADDPLSRSTATGVRSSMTKPAGKSPDDIWGIMKAKEEPPPFPADLGLDLFGATASKPASGPRAGRRAGASVQQSMTDLPPEISREPTPEPLRPAMSPEPSSTVRPGAEPSGGFDRSRSTPRGSYLGEELSDVPTRSAGSAPGSTRSRGNETGMGAEASSTSPPSRATRPSGGGGAVGGAMELDGDELPGLGSPAMLSKNPSTASVHAAAAAAPAGGRRTGPATAAAKPRKEEDSWEMDDNLLPDDSNTPPPAALPPKSPTMGGSSGYTPSAAEAPGRSRLQNTTFLGQKKEEEPMASDEPPETGGYTPSFGGVRRSLGGPGLGGGGLGSSVDVSAGGGGLMGSALNPGGPGAPRPRRQLGAGADTSPLASLSGGGLAGGGAKPGTPPAKKTKEDEERERTQKAMAEAMARRQQLLASGPIRMPGQDRPAPVSPTGFGSTAATDSGVVTTPLSPSPIRAVPEGKPGMGGFGKKVPGLGFSSDSSDDELLQPDKATSPPLHMMAGRKAGSAGHQPSRATTAGPLTRETFDSRVASSVPEMGAAAAAAALGAVPGPGPGSILQSSAPAPPLLPEASYPHSVGSQPSAPNVGPVPSQTPSQLPQPERSGTSSASQPSAAGAAGLLPGVAAVSPQASQMQGLSPPPPVQQQANPPPGVTAVQQQQQPGSPTGVAPVASQGNFPPGMGPPYQQQQPGLPPGVTVMQPQQQQPSLPPGVTQMQISQPQHPGLPPGVTQMQQQPGLPPSVTVIHPQQQQQQPGLPPGVTALQPQQQQQQPGLPPGVTALQPQQQQQRGLPPGVADWQQQQQQQNLPPGVMSMQQNYQRSLPPGVTDLQQQQQQSNVAPGVMPIQQRNVAPGGRYGSPQHVQQGGGMSTAFAVSPDSVAAVTISRAMSAQQQAQQPQPHNVSALAVPSSASQSPGEPTLASRLSLEPLKDALTKSLQDELEKVSKQVAEVKASYDKQLADVRAEYERQLAEARTVHQKQLLDVRALAERQVEEARAHHRKQMEDVHVHNERKLDEVRRRMERQAEEARAAQERVLVEARAQRDKVLEDARLAQTKALEDARGQQQRALEDTRALHERVLADTQAVHVKQVVELKNLYESELRRAAHDVGRAVDDTRRVAEEARRQEAEARRAKEEAVALRDRILGLEAELRARDGALREAETRFVQLDTRSKTELAETQANAIKEAALMKLEMEDAKAALSRVRQQYEEAAMAHAAEVTRYRAELDAQRVMAEEELQRARLATAEQIAAAEARGRRAGMLDKEIAEATIRQQMAAIAEEKEVVARHRLSAELLAQLTEKVRSVAVSSLEREERALSALERDVADREGRLAAREKLLGEREGRVAQREREVDALRADLQNLMVTLETSAVHDREDLKREQLRLTREAARVEAATSSLQAEREDLRVQIAMERRLLEEAREARRREREDLLTEVTAERRRLATEYADTQRQLDAARTELLAVRSRLVDLESRCSGAAAQVAEEEKRLEALRIEASQTRQGLEAETSQIRKALEAEVTQTRQALQAEAKQTRELLQDEVAQARESVFAEVKQTRESLKAEVARTRAELQAEANETGEALRGEKEVVMLKRANVDIEARELVEYAAKLRAQSEELAARAAEAELRDTQIKTTLESLTRNQEELLAAQKQVEEQRVAQEALKKALDKDRKALMEERQGLAEERLAASRSADEARTEQIRLMEAVRTYVQQGIPIPFAMDGTSGRLKPVPPPMRHSSPSPDRHRSGKRRGPRPTGRSRNALKYLLDRLGMDAAITAAESPPGHLGGAGGASGSSYVRAQHEFLEKMRLSATTGPASVGPKLNSMTPTAAARATTVTSPIPAGLNPALLPPGLPAAHARSVVVTPVKHVSTVPVGVDDGGGILTARGQLESEMPASAAPLPSLSVGLADSPGLAAAAVDHDTLSQLLFRHGVGAADEQAFGGGGGTAVIQQLLDTIQMALKKSSRVSASKASDASALETAGHAHRTLSAAVVQPESRSRGGAANVSRAVNSQRRHGGGSRHGNAAAGGEGAAGDGSGAATLPRVLLNTPGMGASLGLESEVPLRDPMQPEGQVSSIASLEPLSASNGSFADVPPPRVEVDSPDLSGPLGRGLDLLAEQLSSSTVFDSAAAATPANTLMSRTAVGASLGSEDYAFGLLGHGRNATAAARQAQLGELAAMSEMLAARLDALGLGQMGGGGMTDSQGSGGFRGVRGGGVEGTSLMNSANLSPRVDMPGGGGMTLRQGTAARLSPLAVASPTTRTMQWAGAAEGLARSLTGAGLGGAAAAGSMATTPRPGLGIVGGGLGSTTRSAADTPLLGSTNADALAGLTMPPQDDFDMNEEDADGEAAREAGGGGGGEGTLSTIASVDTISDDDEAVTSMLP